MAVARVLAGAGTGRAMRVAGQERGRTALSMFWNSAALTLSVFCSAGSGYLFWLVSARLFAPSAVGLASGVVSAMQLCGQFALLGLGSAIVTLLPARRDDPAPLLRLAFGTVMTAGLVMAAGFLLFATRFFHELNAVAAGWTSAAAFLAVGTLWTASLLLDQVFIALRRADRVLYRSLVFGSGRLLLLGGLVYLVRNQGWLAVFGAWAGATVATNLVGALLLLGLVRTRRPKPVRRPGVAREMLWLGLPNHGLNLALLAPGLLLPILVTEVLSASANAYWYTAWMIAGFLFIIPSANGMALFAEAANRPAALRRGAGQSIRVSLALGVPVALALALGIGFVLPLLGRSYVAGVLGPLRILLLGALPLPFIEAYVAVCRATRRLAEATLLCAVNGVLLLTAATIAGRSAGLSAVAVVWLGAESLTGCVAALRLLAIVRRYPVEQPASLRYNPRAARIRRRLRKVRRIMVYREKAIATIVVFAAAFALLAAALGWGESPLRAGAGLVLVWFGTGYLLLAAAFPHHVRWIERLVLSVPASLVVAVLAGLLVSYLPGGLRAMPFVLVLAGAAFVLLGVAILRTRGAGSARWRLRWPSVAAAGGESLRWQPDSRHRLRRRLPARRGLLRAAAWSPAAIVLVVAGAWTVNGMVVAASPAPKPFTALSLEAPAGDASAAHNSVVVENREGHPMQYRLDVTVGGASVAHWDGIAVNAGGRWSVDLPAQPAGGEAEVALYRSGDEQPYRTLHVQAQP